MPRRFGYRSRRNPYRRYQPRTYRPYTAGSYSYNRYGLGRRRPYPWMRDLDEMVAASRRRRERIAREREESEERRPRSTEEDNERERRERERENRRREEERLEKERKEAEELLERMREEERREKEERERLERERAKKRSLSIKDVDLNIVKNSEAHHTNKYEITQCLGDNSELVVRRGQEFNITLILDQEYDKARHDLALHFQTGLNSSIANGTDVSITVDESGRKPSNPNDWHVRLISQDKTNVTVGVFSPSNCIIGEWYLYVTAENKTRDGDVHEEQFECSTDINILLNPWCKEDRVYMKDTDKLDEYCLNDHGVVFQGSSDKIGAKIWNFAQFEVGVLEACFGLLRKSHGYRVGSHMSDPVSIARSVSAIINVNEDDGVLVGNWSGNYEDGTRPTAWMNSADILLKYSRSGGQAVKYAQCWVFSAVVTTVCRALGLPCKSVTCFDSAHDTDGSTTIDRIFTKDKDDNFIIDRHRTNDSIWNFHVWNEVWMKRPDLKDEYNGWQVIDATPQELSDGIHCCGPAPVAAIKTGNCKMLYDVPFVFAEVNSDVVRWEYVNKRTWKDMGRDSKRTGSRIYSKYPDGKPYTDSLTISWRMLNDNPHDVTSDYKFPEGSREERLAVANAAQASSKRRGTPKHEDVTIEMAAQDGVMVGEDFSLNFKVKNSSSGKREISKLHVDLYSKFYNGEIKSKISFTPLSGFTLNGKQDKDLSVSVPTKQYLDKLAEQANMEVIISAQVTLENNRHSNVVKVDNFRLRRPDIEIKMSSACKKGEMLTVQLSFKNYLPKPMTKCVLYLSGPGFEKVKENPQKDVPPRSEWKLSVKVKAKRKGLEQLSATFDSQEVPDITGKAEVQIT